MEKMQKRSKPVTLLISLLGSWIVTAVLLVLLAAAMMKFQLEEGKISAAVTVIYLGSAFLGGRIAGRRTENKKYLCFGGAESQDVEDREPGVNWWKEEMPSDEEYAFCEENLAACDYKVDYVLTHDAPSRFLDFTALASGETNQLHSFLDKILLKLTYDKWFFGCYHKDTQLSTKSRCVFCDVISMGERHAKRSVR